jgi:predicted Zn-dependent protease
MRRLCLGAVLLFTSVILAQVKEYKPSGINFFSKEQEVQLGKESADEVRKTMQVIDNKDLTGYINRIGGRLAKSKHAGPYPYTFEVVHDLSINAFALPGGPMFVHTGLIAALDNESELAGVLAHEMSHVALRHGTANASKANMVQLPAALGGQLAGSRGGILGTLAPLGINAGAQSMLLKYSRSAEKEADLNGAQIMNDVGYDPTQMAKFFEKLEAQGNKDNSKLANFMSDHPTPGNRVQYVTEEAKILPKTTYSELEPENLPRIKQIVASLPAPKPPAPPAAPAAKAVQAAPAASTTPATKTPTTPATPATKAK